MELLNMLAGIMERDCQWATVTILKKGPVLLNEIFLAFKSLRYGISFSQEVL